MGVNDGCIRRFILNSDFKIRRGLRWSIFFVFLAAIGTELASPSGLARFAHEKEIYQSAGRNVSAPTPTQTRTSTPARGAPAAPSNLAASAVSTSQINVRWTDNSNNETGFIVERALLSTGPWTQVGTLPAETTSWGNAALGEGRTYYYRVTAYNSVGKSRHSNVASAKTQSVLPAGAPSNLAVTARSSSQINLTWTDNSSDETGFKIERCQGSACSSFTQVATVANNITSYQNTDLSISTSYSYRIRAYNCTDDSGYSNTATATTARDSIPPTVPRGLTATVVSTSRIKLRWDPPTDSGGSGVAGYNVYQAGERIGSTVTTTFSIKGLAANTQYCYTVTAYDKGGNGSDQSDPACATTKPVSPPDDP